MTRPHDGELEMTGDRLAYVRQHGDSQEPSAKGIRATQCTPH